MRAQLIPLLNANMFELRWQDGTRILISYRTQVAAIFPDGRRIRTEIHHSKTTERHMTQWGVTKHNWWVRVPQEQLDAL